MSNLNKLKELEQMTCIAVQNSSNRIYSFREATTGTAPAMLACGGSELTVAYTWQPSQVIYFPVPKPGEAAGWYEYFIAPKGANATFDLMVAVNGSVTFTTSNTPSPFVPITVVSSGAPARSRHCPDINARTDAETCLDMTDPHGNVTCPRCFWSAEGDPHYYTTVCNNNNNCTGGPTPAAPHPVGRKCPGIEERTDAETCLNMTDPHGNVTCPRCFWSAEGDPHYYTTVCNNNNTCTAGLPPAGPPHPAGPPPAGPPHPAGPPPARPPHPAGPPPARPPYPAQPPGSARTGSQNNSIAYCDSSKPFLPLNPSSACGGTGPSPIPSTGNVIDTLIIAFAYPKQAAYPPVTNPNFFSPAFDLLDWGGTSHITSANTCIAKWMQEFHADGVSRGKVKDVFISVGGAGASYFRHTDLDAMYTAWSGNLPAYIGMLTMWLAQFQTMFGFPLDGIDFDYEYFKIASTDDQGNAIPADTIAQTMARCKTLIDITNATRRAFPHLKISHAPQIPYLASVPWTKYYHGDTAVMGVYVSVMNGCGGSIDFLNVQNYNNGAFTTNNNPDTCGGPYFVPNAWNAMIAGTTMQVTDAAGTNTVLTSGIPATKLKCGVLIGPATTGAPNTLMQPFTSDTAFSSWNYLSGILPTGLMTWQITSMDDYNIFSNLIDRAKATATGVCNPAALPPAVPSPATASACIRIQNTSTFDYSCGYGPVANTRCDDGTSPLKKTGDLIKSGTTASIDVTAASQYRFYVLWENGASANNITFDILFDSALTPAFSISNGGTGSAAGPVQGSSGVYNVHVVFSGVEPPPPPPPKPPNCFWGKTFPAPQRAAYTTLPYRGVNYSGFDFGPPDYVQPTCNAVYFVEAGVNTLRFPFSWEYFQAPAEVAGNGTPINFTTDVSPDGGAGAQGNAGYYATQVTEFTDAGLTVIIDMHNYMRYDPGGVIGNNTNATATSVIGGGQGGPSTAAYATAWGSIAAQFAANPNVMFDLMNEPHDLDTALILTNYNAAIAAIRAAESRAGGKPHTILLEGNGWSGMHSWLTGTDSGTFFVPANIHDPAQNYVINVHQYLDSNFSGQKTTCIDAASVAGLTNIAPFYAWLQQNKLRAMVTEFNAHVVLPADNCASALTTLLGLFETYAEKIPGTGGFVGWTAWGAGSFGTDYLLSLNPYLDAKGVVQPSPAFAVLQSSGHLVLPVKQTQTRGGSSLSSTSKPHVFGVTAKKKHYDTHCKSTKPFVIGISIVAALAFVMLVLLFVQYWWYCNKGGGGGGGGASVRGGASRQPSALGRGRARTSK